MKAERAIEQQINPVNMGDTCAAVEGGCCFFRRRASSTMEESSGVEVVMIVFFSRVENVAHNRVRQVRSIDRGVFLLLDHT